MESFLRRKLGQTGGNILGGSSLQKPVSSYQFKLPELSSSFYAIADEPFPQVSGFLDDTVSPSFVSNETILSTPACTPSENHRKNKNKCVTNDSGLNCSLAVPCHSTSANASNRSLQSEKHITSATAGKADVDAVALFQFPASLETSDLMNEDLKNSTFDVTQDLKEPSDNAVNATVDLQSIKKKNSTFDLTKDSKEQSNSGATADLHNIKEKIETFNLTHDSQNIKSDSGAAVTADLQNSKEKNSTFNLTHDSNEQSDSVTAVAVSLQNIKVENNTLNLTQDLKDQPNAGTNTTVDLQNIKEKNGTFDLTQDLNKQSDNATAAAVSLQNIKEENNTLNLTQDLKDQPNTGTNTTVDLQNIKEKNGTFDLTQDSKDQSNTGTSPTVDLQNINEKNGTFNVTLDSKEPSDICINRIVGLQNIKEKNGTFDLTPDSKDQSNPATNPTVDLQNIKEKNSTFDLTPDSKEPSETGTNGNVDLHNIKEKNSTLESQEKKESSKTRLNSTVDIDVPSIKAGSANATVDLVPKEGPETTVDVPNVEITLSKTNSPAAPLNTTKEQPIEKLEGTIDIQPYEKQDGSLNSEDDKLKNAEEANFKVNITVEEEQMGSAPCQPSGDISRSSIFSLDETLNMKTSFMFTSTPIVFGKESRFEILRDTKPTPMRKRLSVINSIEVQSNDELVGASNHDGTDAMQATERSSQKVPSTHSTSEPANENKPPTKLPMKRRLPQLSSKLSNPKSTLPPLPSSINSSAAVKPKTVRGPQTQHAPNTSSTPHAGNRRTVQMKGKSIAPVKNTVPASTVKTSVVSSISGSNFTAVAKPSSCGIPQMKPSGLQPPTRKRPAPKTAQTPLSSVETAQTQPSKPCALPGMRTRNSLLSRVGQMRLNNDGLPSAKRKRIAPTASSTAESDAVHPAEGAHGSGCANCVHLEEKLESILQELKVLRPDCKNWGLLHEKLDMCIKEMKRI